MDTAVHPAPAGRRIHYERRRPAETTLYQLVQEHLETFLAQVEAETGAGLPDFVKEEFDAFLECGILAHGFLRLRCAVNEDLKEEWQKYLEQTQNHERVMREFFEKMGLDPEAMIAVRGVSYCGQLQLRVRGEFR
jgi:hypothetical protein